MLTKCNLGVLVVLTLSLLNYPSAGYTGSMSSDGWWMRPGDATYELWSFTGLGPATLNDPFQIDLSIYVTNQVNGGSGYSTAVKVTITNPATSENLVFNEVWLQNSLGTAWTDFTQTPFYLHGTNPSFSQGYGYMATGEITVPAYLVSLNGTLEVKVERISDYQVQDAFGFWNPHVGDSLNQLGITVSAGSGTPPPNHNPIANAGPDQSVISIGGANANVTLNGSASRDDDPGDFITSYTWTWPGNTRTGVSPTISLAPGSYTITLTVEDNGSPALSDTDTVDIDVVSHRPVATLDSITSSGPSANLRFHKTDSSTVISFNGSASDDQGHAITGYQWRSSIDGVFAATQDTTKKPTNFSVGDHSIYFSCTCSAGATSTEDEYARILISDLPTLSIVSADADWVGDSTSYNLDATIKSKVTAAGVRLDSVQYSLTGSDDPPHPTTWTDNVDISPNASRTVTHSDEEQWQWCPNNCLSTNVDYGPQEFDYVLKAYVTDEQGYEFWLPQCSPSCYLSVTQYKKNQYIDAGMCFADGIAATADAAACSLLGPFGVAPAIAFGLIQTAAMVIYDTECENAKDPWLPNPNYQSEVVVPPLTIDPGLLCEQDIEISQKCWRATQDILKRRESLRALYKVIPRMLGAAEQYDPVWTTIHCADALRFGAWAAEDFEAGASSFNEVRKMLDLITTENITVFQQQLATSGFPAGEIVLFEQLGLTEAEIEKLRNVALGADPQDIVEELHTDREVQIKALAGVFRGLPRSIWPHEQLAIAITAPREQNYVKGQVGVEVTGWSTLYYPVIACTITVDGLPPGQIPPLTWDTSSVADGVSTLTAAAMPQFGPPVVDSITVTVDNTPPDLTITSPVPGDFTTYDGPIPLVYSLQDALDNNPRVSCVMLNGIPFAEDTIPALPGAWELVIKGIDAAGNLAEASVSFNIYHQADINRNWETSIDDFAEMSGAWLALYGQANYNENADLNGDGGVAIDDLALFAGEWLDRALPAPVGWWAFDDQVGVVAVDSGSGGNHGDLLGNPDWLLDAQRGVCLDFDGGGNYVKTQNNANGLDFAPDSFSITAWINARVTISGNWQTIVEYDRYNAPEGSGTNWFGIWLSPTGRFHFRVGLSTKNSNLLLQPDTWYFLAATFDSSSKTMRLYIDGQLDSPATIQNSGFTAPCQAKLTIAAYGLEDGQYFNGAIDDIRIYKAALTPQEIQNLFENQ